MERPKRPIEIGFENSALAADVADGLREAIVVLESTPGGHGLALDTVRSLLGAIRTPEPTDDGMSAEERERFARDRFHLRHTRDGEIRSRREES